MKLKTPADFSLYPAWEIPGYVGGRPTILLVDAKGLWPMYWQQQM
jgi:hypothetical protein